MTRWSKCTCTTFYEDDREAEVEECEVVIAGDRIVIDTRHVGGGWMYEGQEVGPGHFRVECFRKAGRGTLHRDEAENVLEGWWHDDGSSGMWRINLEETDE